MISDIKNHLENAIIPFWKGLRDDEFGGYYGYMDFDTLTVDKKYVKGCILHSRILWFFSNAYMLLKDESLKNEADHAFEFITKNCIDKENGGIYWAVNYDGSLNDSLKHTYNQAFCIYAMSSYYDATGNKEALNIAYDLYNLIETKCRDVDGYLEAFTKDFKMAPNDELSENGVMADRTMNTLLHVLEAYTELYRVDGNSKVEDSLRAIMDIFMAHMYNPTLKRQDVFFDLDYNSLIDLHSYGHDIETSWLMDRALEVLDDEEYTKKLTPITKDLAAKVFDVAFDGRSLANECERGVVDTKRVWWVQAETVVGFVNAYQKSGDEKYLKAAGACWNYIKDVIVDKRAGSEWLSEVDASGLPLTKKPIVEPWKCPYHNGRMCMEIIKRGIE